jgi:hypothetical protein
MLFTGDLTNYFTAGVAVTVVVPTAAVSVLTVLLSVTTVAVGVVVDGSSWHEANIVATIANAIIVVFFIIVFFKVSGVRGTRTLVQTILLSGFIHKLSQFFLTNKI